MCLISHQQHQPFDQSYLTIQSTREAAPVHFLFPLLSNRFFFCFTRCIKITLQTALKAAVKTRNELRDRAVCNRAKDRFPVPTHCCPREWRTNPALEKKVKLNSIDFVHRLYVPPPDAPPPPMVRLNYFSNSPQQLAKLLLTFLLPLLLLLCLVRLFVSALSIGGRFVRKKNSHQSSFHFLRSVQRVALGALERLQLQHKLAPLLCVAPSPVARKMW